MISKKAQGLSVNFLVKFVLAVVLFGLGVGLMWNIYADSRSTLDITQGEFDNRLFDLNCRSTETLCVASAKTEINGGENILIGAKVYNNLDQTINGKLSVELHNESKQYSNQNIELRPEVQNIEIDAKSSKELTFAVITSKNAPKGKYVVRFNLERDELADVPKRFYFTIK